jgi:hypothetical protein
MNRVQNECKDLFLERIIVCWYILQIEKTFAHYSYLNLIEVVGILNNTLYKAKSYQSINHLPIVPVRIESHLVLTP